MVQKQEIGVHMNRGTILSSGYFMFYVFDNGDVLWCVHKHLWYLMLIVFCEVLDLLHDFTEYLGTILRWITVFDQTYLDIELELIADNLIIEPISE